MLETPLKPRIGVLLPTRGLLMEGNQPDDIEEVLLMAEEAEQAGLDSVWLGDSLTAKPRLEPLTTLSALAVRTSKVRLGTAVMLGALRHPVSLAHAAATADMISRGRIVLGMGVGGAFNEAQRQEWKNVGVDSRHRADLFEELVKIFKPLTRGEMVTFEGEHFSVKDVSIKPVSSQPMGVPVLIAAHGRSGLERQYKRVLFGDGAISISDSPQEYADALGRIRFHAENAGIDYESIEKIFYMTVNISDNREEAFNEADRFLNIYYGMNIWGERWGPWGPPEEVARRAESYLAAGANTIIFRFASFDQRKQMDLFLNDVVPYL